MVGWYAGGVAASLLLFGVVLYFTVSQIVLGPVSESLAQTAQDFARPMLAPAALGAPNPCQFSDAFHGDQRVLLWACFDSHGHLVGGSQVAAALPKFTAPSIALEAAKSSSGTATDRVTVENVPIQRYALTVQGRHGPAAVVLVGIPVTGELHSLHDLLLTLLRLGAAMFLISIVAGYFLAGRSLIPVRAAQLRQQEFIADASHELRTPLTLLRADAEVLLRSRSRLPPEDAELLTDVIHEVDHMSGLADSMLQLARLDSGAAHMERDIVDLSEVATLIGQRVAARAAELGLMIRVDARVRQCVLGDPLLISQAALALVDNALKYTEHGGTVTIEVEREGDTIAFRVCDTGEGIAGEHLAHLGKRFYRVDKARARSMGGAGLGLSIVSRIAAQHGGELHVSSEPGMGTTASISFPRP
jgi:signal transduction histidine kinase